MIEKVKYGKLIINVDGCHSMQLLYVILVIY